VQNNPINAIDPWGLHDLMNPVKNDGIKHKHTHEKWQGTVDFKPIYADTNTDQKDPEFGHIRFFPLYDTLHPELQMATDYHELLHKEFPDMPHSQIYQKEIDYLYDRRRFYHRDDPVWKIIDDHILVLELTKQKYQCQGD
jgi:hypothetical protein